MKTTESPFTLGKSGWERQSALPDIWKVVHQCKNAGFDSHATTTIIHWYVFFKQHDAATLEEFLQKFAEGAKKRDFYGFSKYCLTLYCQVHKEQLERDVHPVEKNLIRQIMKEAEEMDELGDEYRNPADDYWQKNACIAGPDYRELPRSYVKLMSSFGSFEEFLEAHKCFDVLNESLSPRTIDADRKRTTHEIHDALKK